MKTGKQIKYSDGEIGTVKIIGDFLPEPSASVLRDVVVGEDDPNKKFARSEDDPFAAFSEWASEEDGKAYDNL
jgi:hypothetical protein